MKAYFIMLVISWALLVGALCGALPGAEQAKLFPSRCHGGE